MRFLPVILKPCAVMAINEDTCLHGDGPADVRIVATGHYSDRFCWLLCVCILFPFLGPYQRLAQPDILPLLTISYWQFNSLTCDAVIEIGTNAVLYSSLTNNCLPTACICMHVNW